MFFFLSWILMYNCEYTAWKVSPYSWWPCTHTLSLEGPGPQPKNCGSVQWMAAVFRLSIVHKKQCVLGRLHLHKHPGTGQGPAARRCCSWRFLSHWCASVQKPCKSSHKIDTNAQGQINTRKKEAMWRHYTISVQLPLIETSSISSLRNRWIWLFCWHLVLYMR